MPPEASGPDEEQAEAPPARVAAEEEPATETSPDTKTAPDTETASDSADRININTASEVQLMALPGVGPALAGRIMAYRQKRSFKSPGELRRVRGIGPAKFSKLQSMITVD
jgi:competence protein ComEA